MAKWLFTTSESKFSFVTADDEMLEENLGFIILEICYNKVFDFIQF